MVKISVIIPVYNTEKYLKKCLNSVMDQTIYKELEIIIINDGSTDSSNNIIDKFNNLNIMKITKQNEGLSATRNIGIQHSSGEYIYFLDSDDWIESDYLELLYRNAEKYKTDILFSNYYFSYDNKKLLNKIDKNIYELPVISGLEFLKKSLEYHSYNSGVCVCLYNKKFLIKNNLKFEEKLRYSEEQEFTPRALICAKKVKCIDISKYYYRQHSMSMTKIITENNVYDLFLVYDNLKKAGEKIIDKSIKNFFCEFVDYYFIPKIYNIISFLEENKIKKIDDREIIKKFKIKYLKKISKVERILMIFTKINKNMTFTLCKFYRRKIKKNERKYNY